MRTHQYPVLVFLNQPCDLQPHQRILYENKNKKIDVTTKHFIMVFDSMVFSATSIIFQLYRGGISDYRKTKHV
jgi:hypothetical protein